MENEFTEEEMRKLLLQRSEYLPDVLVRDLKANILTAKDILEVFQVNDAIISLEKGDYTILDRQETRAYVKGEILSRIKWECPWCEERKTNLSSWVFKFHRGKFRTRTEAIEQLLMYDYTPICKGCNRRRIHHQKKESSMTNRLGDPIVLAKGTERRYPSCGHLIRRARIRAGFQSLQSLAEVMGWTRIYQYHLENDKQKTISGETMDRLLREITFSPPKPSVVYEIDSDAIFLGRMMAGCSLKIFSDLCRWSISRQVKLELGLIYTLSENHIDRVHSTLTRFGVPHEVTP